MDNVVPPKSGTRTIEQNYDETKKSVDAALKEGELPVDKTPSTHDVGVDDVQDGFVPKTNYQFIDGTCAYLPVDGNESFGNTVGSFMETTKKWAMRFIQLAEDFLEWLIEFASNKVRNARRRLQDLKRDYHGRGIKVKTVKYPHSIGKLAGSVDIPSSPNFAIKALDEVNKLYKSVMDFQKHLAGLTKELPKDVTPEMTLNLAEVLAKSYIKAVGAKNSSKGMESTDLPTSATRINVKFDRSVGLNGFGITKSINPRMKYRVPESFIPDADTVNNLILKLDVYLLDVEAAHHSQRRFAHNFKVSMRPFMSSASKFTEDAANAAKAYYRWLIKFQNNSINIPLHYYLSVINAAIELCEVQVKSTTVTEDKS